jgi:hypothetical protein
MKRWLSIGAALAVVAGVVAWVIFIGNARAPYEKLRMHVVPLNLVEIDADEQAFADEVRSKWRLQSSEIDGDGEILDAGGITPTVANWVDVQTWKMPEFSCWNWRANRRNAELATLFGFLAMRSDDRTVYAARDRTLAYVRVRDGLVWLMTNDPAGLRGSIYVRPQQ